MQKHDWATRRARGYGANLVAEPPSTQYDVERQTRAELWLQTRRSRGEVESEHWHLVPLTGF